MAFIALDPPYALPLGTSMTRLPSPGSGSVAYPQSYSEPKSDVH